jgi:DNA-binding transcriptional regulator YiaG
VATFKRTPLPVIPKTIGEHIHKRRRELALTQRQAAGLLGVGLQTLIAWEANQCQPREERRRRIIAWLGFDPSAG